MRRAARVDKNQVNIVKALRQVGADVQHLHFVGQGCPDILVGHRGTNYLMEIKSNPKAELTADELEWHLHWRGQVCIVYSVQDALRTIGVVP